jgi:glycosyltransferase involved in cell wall biosynthesis
LSPLVSVLLPVFNAASTLDETLRSLFAQTLAEFEIVAVDDGSDDGSAELLRRWSARDARLRVKSGPHSGIVDALNSGLELCRGSLVARMDADDTVHTQRLAKQAQMFDGHPELSVVGSLVETVPRDEVAEGLLIYERWLNSLVDHRDISREMFIESPIAHPSAMVRRDEILQLGGYRDCGWPEDYDLWLRYHLRGSRFAKVNEVLLYWREHPGRLTRTDRRYSVENFLKVKSHFLVAGPLADRDAVFLWGAGKTGRRLSKHLIRGGCIPTAVVDIDPKKIGSVLRGRPIVAPDELPQWWARFRRPFLVVAVASRGARALIRRSLATQGLTEGTDFLFAA